MVIWKVTSVGTSSVGGLNDVIVRCTFDVLASDGAKHSCAFGEVDLLPPDAAAFVAFDSVTHEQAVEWVKQALGAAVDEYEAKVQAQLANQPEPVSFVQLPWSK
jgi:hypothetical protein